MLNSIYPQNTNVDREWAKVSIVFIVNSFLKVKSPRAFIQEKALVEAFTVIVKLLQALRRFVSISSPLVTSLHLADTWNF